jgi:hypothetical protein
VPSQVFADPVTFSVTQPCPTLFTGLILASGNAAQVSSAQTVFEQFAATGLWQGSPLKVGLSPGGGQVQPTTNPAAIGAGCVVYLIQAQTTDGWYGWGLASGEADRAISALKSAGFLNPQLVSQAVMQTTATVSVG